MRGSSLLAQTAPEFALASTLQHAFATHNSVWLGPQTKHPKTNRRHETIVGVSITYDLFLAMNKVKPIFYVWVNLRPNL
jgi:hypothetical protein